MKQCEGNVREDRRLDERRPEERDPEGTGRSEQGREKEGLDERWSDKHPEAAEGDIGVLVPGVLRCQAAPRYAPTRLQASPFRQWFSSGVSPTR
jgi:hypothetical protein